MFGEHIQPTTHSLFPFDKDVVSSVSVSVSEDCITVDLKGNI